MKVKIKKKKKKETLKLKNQSDTDGPLYKCIENVQYNGEKEEEKKTSCFIQIHIKKSL